MSEIFYKPVKVLCTDNVTRTARVKCYCYDGSFAADTFFSVPAYVKANGKTVRGYLTSDNDVYKFRAYLYCKNHAAIPLA
jgi:hypothetical protein